MIKTYMIFCCRVCHSIAIAYCSGCKNQLTPEADGSFYCKNIGGDSTIHLCLDCGDDS